jgi:vWA found in TerF C terminus
MTQNQSGRQSTARSGRRQGYRRRRRRLRAAGAAACLLALIGAASWALRSGPDSRVRPGGDSCQRLRVVAASGYADVIRRVSAAVRTGPACSTVEVIAADGEDAVEDVEKSAADAWVPDDTAWRAFAPADLLARTGAEEDPTGTVLATTPVYMITDRTTGRRIAEAGSSWRGLAGLASGPGAVWIKVVDPEHSGDGLVGLGSLAEGVWRTSGMNASATSLVRARPAALTVEDVDALLPTRTGEVALISERALMSRPPSLGPQAVVLSGRDRTAMLRFTWFPTVKGRADPARSAAGDRLRTALGSSAAAPALAAEHLRGPGDGLGMPPKAGATAGAGADAGADSLPTLSTPAFDVLTDHRVEHVLAAWKPAERRARILVVIDVSQSMNARAPGSDKPLLNVVAEGCLALAKLLPDDSTLGVWVFGTQLQGTRDHQILVPPRPLDATQRGELAAALGDLRTRRTGTGLYDTVLAAYRADLSSPVEDAPPAHVLVFTDGRNEADPGSVSSAELGRQLLAARRVQQPRSLSVLAFGRPTGRDEVTAAIKPVGGYLEPALTAQDVTAAFVHLAAGGLHSEYGGS